MVNLIGLAIRNRRVGRAKMSWNHAGLAAPESFTLTSSMYADGGAIPESLRGKIFGHNTSPDLAWTAVPESAVELVIVMEDPDAPFGAPFVHGLVSGIDPALGGVPVDGLTAKSTIPGLTLGKVAGQKGFFGPMAPKDAGPHTYVFEAYAVSKPTSLKPGFNLAQLIEQISGNVVARAKLEGVYEKH